MKSFDAQAFLDSAGASTRAVAYRRAETIFFQGEPGDAVLYIQTGGVRLSATSKAGREATVAMLGPGDFLGEGCLAGQSFRMGTATAMTRTTALVIDKDEMFRALHAQHALSDRFIEYMLSRNIRIEEDLIDQLFDSTEKRLARTLLRLARFGTQDRPRRVLPKMSPAALAKVIGTSPAHVRAFMKKFTRLGFIDDGAAGLTINNSLLNVVLHD
jgi:CRP/FNR family cyclic AMP-dependent transcriptional regulator